MDGRRTWYRGYGGRSRHCIVGLPQDSEIAPSLDRRDSTIILPQQSLVVAAVLIDQRRTHVVYREHGCSA